MMPTQVRSSQMPGQDALYEQIASDYAAPLARLARAYEADPALRQDLLQEIYFALWRSFSGFDNRCSLRTWVYRVAHNIAATHVQRDKRHRFSQLLSLEELAALPDPEDEERRIDEAAVLAGLGKLIQQLGIIDRDVILLYLEGIDAAGIAEITGLSSTNIATKVHRIKALLTRRFHAGVTNMREEEWLKSWQNQPMETLPMSIEQLRVEVHAFQKTSRRGYLLECMAAVMVFLGYGAIIWFSPNLWVKVGSSLIILAGVFILHQFRKRWSARAVPAENVGVQILEFHKQELVRRRDMLRSSWVWYISPLVPGMIVYWLGMAQEHPQNRFTPIGIAICFATFFAVGLINEWRARRVQRQIDALNSLTSDRGNMAQRKS